MPKSEPMLSVAEVLELEPGDEQNATWINPGFTAVVLNIKSTKTKSGTPMHITTLGGTNEVGEISMTLFGKCNISEGDTIEVSGKGLRRTVFNRLQQVSVGKETEIHVIGTHVAASRPAATAPAGSATREAEARHENASPASSSFHDKMKGNALLYLHALAYARKINTTLKETGHEPLSQDHFQACVSTLFIAGDRAGCSLNPPPISSKPAAAAPPAEPTPAPQGGRADPPKGKTKPPAGPDGTVALPENGEDVPF